MNGNGIELVSGHTNMGPYFDGNWAARATAATRPPFVPRQPGPKFELRLDDVWPQREFYGAVARRLIEGLAEAETLPKNTVDFLGRMGVWVIGGNNIVETGTALADPVSLRPDQSQTAGTSYFGAGGPLVPGGMWPNTL